MNRRWQRWAWLALSIVWSASTLAADAPRAEQFAPHESALAASGQYTNPYLELTAEAALTPPAGGTPRNVPLFWDGGSAWKFRVAPDQIGAWTWSVKSADAGLNGKSGSFDVVASKRAGSIRPMKSFPRHFERQDSAPFWFLGDTAWALYTDKAEEKHDRTAALRYVDTRAAQGINVLHSMLLSEAGWGNQGGKPWDDLSAQRINPGYWQEVDLRLAHANSKRIVCGLALAWGDKRKQEPFAWRMFPDVEARKRYARYIAARYSAYDVYFIVSGEWHGEVRTRPSTDDAVRKEFIEIGEALAAADPHGRMVAIHPMTAQGSVREFNAAKWMSFGDYQQNYRDLHGRVLESMKLNKPVVNSEYGYFLRDQSGDGVPDKDNSTSAAAMRHASWDIAMAGGYIVTGFGTTYFGGNRDPGPFDLDAKKNDEWEAQLGHLSSVFSSREWWKLRPHDELLECTTARDTDGKEFNQIVPPATTYWCLAEPWKQYMVYARGLKAAVSVKLDPTAGPLSATQVNPRTGNRKDLGAAAGKDRFEFRPPDEQDWVVILAAAAADRAGGGAKLAPTEGKIAADYFPPPDSAGGWRTPASAAEARRLTGIDVTRLDDALAVCKASTKNGGLLVAKGGWLVYEQYFGLAHRDATPNLASIGKSFTSIAVGILMSEHPQLFPDGLDQKVFQPVYLPPEGFPLSDPAKAEIKLGQLLAFTAGIRGNNPSRVLGKEVTIDPPGPDGAVAMIDAVALGRRPIDHQGKPTSAETLWCQPGEGYSYASSSAHLASMIVRHVSGMEQEAFLRERLAKPLGWGPFTYGYKNSREVTHTPGGGGIAVRATDMARFGYLLLREGRWAGREIVPAEFVHHCGRASPYNPHAPYSLQFDVNTDGHMAGFPRDAFWKSGSGAHMLYIVPSLDLVVWKLAGRDGQYGEADTGVKPDPAAVKRSAGRRDWQPTLGEREGQHQVLRKVIAAIVDQPPAAGR